jgi:hypothetical protein
MRRGAQAPSCSFCGQARQGGIIAGPGGIFICAACVPLAAGVLSAGEPAAAPAGAAGALRRVPAGTAGGGCSFCGKRPDKVGGIAATDRVAICDECLDLCEEILTGQ